MKKSKKEKKLAKQHKRAGNEGTTNGTAANASAHPTTSVDINATAPADVPIASKTGSTGAAANEGIAAGTSQVSSRKVLKAQVEDIEDE